MNTKKHEERFSKLDKKIATIESDVIKDFEGNVVGDYVWLTAEAVLNWLVVVEEVETLEEAFSAFRKRNGELEEEDDEN